MLVIVPPVIVDGKICRIVAPVQSLLEVQEWMGDFWLPSDVLLSTAAASEPAPLSLLHSNGVPRADHGQWPQRSTSMLTEGALIARASRPRRPAS
jgi:hypothetical protein